MGPTAKGAPRRHTPDEVSRALDHARKVIVQRINVIRRKRSWRASEKAMATAQEQMMLLALAEHHEDYQREHGLGGF